MKALIMVEIDPFLSPDEPEPKLKNYKYALSVMNEVGIPVIYRENEDLIMMPEKITRNVMEGTSCEEWQSLYDEGWNDCIEEIEKNVREAEHD